MSTSWSNERIVVFSNAIAAMVSQDIHDTDGKVAAHVDEFHIMCLTAALRGAADYLESLFKAEP